MRLLLQDLRHGARMLLHRPGFTALTALTLALGIGANTAIFSVVHGVLLRPLPYRDPDRLVYLWGRVDMAPGLKSSLAPPDLVDYREQSRLFADFAATSATFSATLTGEGEPEQVPIANVTENFFRFLGVEPALGRVFLSEDGMPGDPNGPPAPGTVLISHGLWQRRYGGDPGVVGRTIQLGGFPNTVAGVLPERFVMLAPPGVGMTPRIDVWWPLRMDFAGAPRDMQWLRMLGRLKPGVTSAQAQAEMDAITSRQREQVPFYKSAGLRVDVAPMHADVVGHARPVLLVLLGAVGLVLLITCADVANLLLARTAARKAEIAVRTALGASRGRIVRQFLTETLLLCSVGGALGLLFAWWGVSLLVSLQPPNLPRLEAIQIDGTVLGFGLGASVLAALLAGLAPALQASRPDLTQSLKEAARSSGSLRRGRLRSALIVGEVALSLVLLIGTGLMLRSFANLQQVRPGFDAHNLLTFSLSLPWNRYREPERRAGFYRRLEDRLRALPGVRSVGGVFPLPLSGRFWTGPYAAEGAAPGEYDRNQANYRSILPGYFEAMGARLLAGRFLSWDEVAESRPVIVVDHLFARSVWPGQDAVGKRLQMQGGDLAVHWVEVAGVVEHLRHDTLTTDSLPTVYYPPGLWGWGDLALTVRTEMDPLSAAGPIRQEIRQMDKDLAVYDVKTMQQAVDASLAPVRFSLTLIGLFAALALVLAALGLYGVVSYSVRQRTQELGVRLALGARAGQIVALVLGQGLRLVLFGLAAGLAAAFALTRALDQWLYQVSSTDPAVYAGLSLLLAAVALLASYVPARRACRVDPLVALRHE
jgi:predicted permease